MEILKKSSIFNEVTYFISVEFRRVSAACPLGFLALWARIVLHLAPISSLPDAQTELDLKKKRVKSMVAKSYWEFCYNFNTE